MALLCNIYSLYYTAQSAANQQTVKKCKTLEQYCHTLYNGGKTTSEQEESGCNNVGMWKPE
jgi:hypothetical protein